LSKIQIQKDARKLFYNEYKIRASLQIPYCTLLRAPCTVKRIEWLIRMQKTNPSPKYINYSGRDHITDKKLDIVKDRLLAAHAWLEQNGVKYSVRRDMLFVYSNNRTLIDEAFKLGNGDKFLCNAHGIPGEITMNECKFKYRLFFKAVKVDKNTKNSVLSFINNTDDVETSNATEEFLMRTYQYSQTTHFIDYNDDKIVLMLALIAPKLIGKQFKLIEKNV